MTSLALGFAVIGFAASLRMWHYTLRWLRTRSPEDDYRGDLYMLISSLAFTVALILEPAPAWAPACTSLSVVLAAWRLWRNRRKRDRAPRAFGAKSRARVAALVRKARETAKPRPALRPVPGGVS
jgi:hypothetical protein